MQSESPEPYPKTLPGVVVARWARCGRPNCRCARGEPHGPYWARYWREGGRLRKKYVRLEEVEQVRAQCDARRQLERELAVGWTAWRALLAAIREAEGS